MILTRVVPKCHLYSITILITNKLKRLFLAVSLLLSLSACGDKGRVKEEPPVPGPRAFACGADISWVSEMEAGGVKFRMADGSEADIFKVLNESGVNAIRLRVWVNPVGGRWSGKEDVVALAKRADAAGMAVMIDFHYSDLFADPQRQIPPAAWRAFDLARLQRAVSEHTTEVLTALKSAGVTPKWVQVGNETRNGMLWPTGQLWDTRSGFAFSPARADIAGGWQRYITLSNAGYSAVKNVFPKTAVLVHIDNAWDKAASAWWFEQFKNGGGRMDMIGLSHYPQSTASTWQQANQAAVDNINSLAQTWKVDVMVVEIGMKQNNPAEATRAMQDFLDRVAPLEACAGVFYWEPECYGGWKPAFYSLPAYNWNAYDMGAFTPDGRAGSVLGCFSTLSVRSGDVPHPSSES